MTEKSLELTAAAAMRQRMTNLSSPLEFLPVLPLKNGSAVVAVMVSVVKESGSGGLTSVLERRWVRVSSAGIIASLQLDQTEPTIRYLEPPQCAWMSEGVLSLMQPIHELLAAARFSILVVSIFNIHFRMAA